MQYEDTDYARQLKEDEIQELEDYHRAEKEAVQEMMLDFAESDRVSADIEMVDRARMFKDDIFFE